METKRGAIGIVFDEKDSERYFLLCHRCLNWNGWEFVKGGIEDGETPEEAVVREAWEEARIKNVKIVKKLPDKVEWFSDKNYSFDVFLIRGSMDEGVQHNGEEHDCCEWVKQEKVLETIKYPENKDVFKKALKEFSQ